MTTPRIAPLEPPYPEAMQQDFDRVMRGLPPLNIFRTVAHNPRVLSRMVAGGLLDKGSISLRQRELVILRTCAPARCAAPNTNGAYMSPPMASRRSSLSSRWRRRCMATPARRCGAARSSC